MADEGPPKPKPGSLKDRIKQFEVSSSSSSSSPAPPPLRPKPGTLGQWKPKPLDPPSPNKQMSFSPSSQEASQTSEDHAHASGMSATDAISSISKGGGSLKERMAALQGKGAFGETSASVAPPLPSNEGKPRVWRVSPAPPVEPKVEEGAEHTGDKAEVISQERSPIGRSPVSPLYEAKGMDAVPDEGAGAATSETGNDDEEKTEEEQERERRAAIAARMARLGGARVGMPVGFGIAAKGLHGGAKPAIPAKPRLVTPGDTGSAGSSAPPSAMSPAPPSGTDDTDKPGTVRQSTLDKALKVPLPKSQGSLLTPGSLDDSDIPSESDATASGKLVPPRSPAIPKSPDSMPIPALPKRATGPRRKKSAKELKPASGSTGDAETPPIPSSDPSQEAKEPQVPNLTQEESQPGGEETKPVLSRVPDQSSAGLMEEPGSAIDDLVSAAPSESATPPPPSPSVLATEDEDDESMGEGPSRRPTIELSTHEEKIVEEEGSQLLTPRPRSDSSEQMGGASLSVALSNMMQSEPRADEENPVENAAGEGSMEEDEAARKRRVAEKMARLGAVNPFAPGFTPPVSPQGDKHGQAVVKKEEDNADKKLEEDSGQASVTKNTADNDSDVDLAAHESEPNVPVLSQSRSRLSQEAHNEENDLVANTVPAEGGTGYQEALDDDVDYPMMSPVTDGQHETPAPFVLPDVADEARSRKGAAVESSPQYDDENEYSDDDERADTETIHDREKEGSPPKQITRTAPPLPHSPRLDLSVSPGLSSPSSSHSPTAHEFEDSSPRATLAAALARRAPRPPPEHQPSVSPPTHSVSPTPSPPPRPFVREGAPSPPSLKAYSNIDEEEEMSEEEEIEYVDDELSDGPDEMQETPTEEHNEPPTVDERTRTPSPPPLPKLSPPPLPAGRPLVPNVRRSIPPLPRHASTSTSHADVSTRLPLPIPKQSVMAVPSSPSDGGEREVDYIADAETEDTRTIQQAIGRPPLPPPRRNGLTPEHGSRASGKIIQAREVMDDEGDPVDPDFVENQQFSPSREMAATGMRENAFSEVQDDTESSPPAFDPEADAEAARRRTIAERMAKLGGIKFGVPVTARPSPIRKHSESREETETEVPENRQDPDMDVDNNQTPEEAERARRAGIAARMAAMGGRGFGMYGAGAAPTAMPSSGAKVVVAPSHGPAPNASLASPPPPPLPGSRPKRHSRDGVAHAITRPPPPAPTNELGGSAQDGETSESEVEMINPETEEEGEMVEEVEDEEPELVETPPAPPNRSGRPPLPTASRPALPPPSSELTGPPLSAGRSAYPPPSLQNDYEVVNDELRTVPTVPRMSHSRSIPPPIAESASHPSLDSSGQWELPNIPSGSFDLGNYGKGPGVTAGTSAMENEASWTKVEQEQSGARAKASTSNQPPEEPFIGPAPAPISTEALTSLAHRMGPTIVSSAQHIHEKSKKAVIGDGSSTSFLLMVFSSVRGASTTSLGHLVYAQTGGAVQRRLGDIMPGDVVALYDARFKGHKGGLGLGAYSVSWGSREEPVLGIITEFEGKKNKIKALAVNQHPNSYPTTDTPSYKLDDLKAGTLKVFRVAENP